MHRAVQLVLAVVLSALGAASSEATVLEHPLFQAVRKRDAALLDALLREGTPVNVVDASGTTPLMIAARDGDLESVRLLLAHGADVSAANRIGATALLWAAGEPEKVRLLLAAGASPATRSALGNTPLIVAAGCPESQESLALLLAAEAAISSRNAGDETALSAAARMGNLDSVRLLLAHGADPQPALKPWAILNSRKPEVVEIITLLAAGGADVNRADEFAGHTLNYALLNEQFDVAELLVRLGARLDLPTPEGRVPPMVLAAYTELDDDRMARLLIDRGAPVSATNAANETALHWARRRGHSKLAEFLSGAGADDKASHDVPPIPQRSIRLHAGNQDEVLRAAIAKSVALLERSSEGFLRQRGNCVSCHQQNLPAVAMAWARDRGFRVNAHTIESMVDVQRRSWSPRVDHAYQLDEPLPGGIEQIGYGLWGFGALGVKPDETSRAMVWYLATQQFADGRWVGDLMRPPSEGPDLLATVLAMRVLQLYPLAGRQQEFAERIAKAAAWLKTAPVTTHQERALRLLALAWAGLPSEELARLGKELLAEQRADGGWAQLPALASDAYATGQSLVALRVAGALAPTDDAYQRGLEFLLSTQFDDGAWFVRSRSWPFQPPFESGFPFGKDQWISAPATAWATMALTLAVQPRPGVAVAEPLPEHAASAKSPPPAAAAASVSPNKPGKLTIDFVRDIRPLLERSCLDCHSGDDAKGGFRVVSRAALVQGGDSELSAMAPGKSQESVLLRLVADKAPEREMPPLFVRDKFPALSAAEIELLRAWIDQGMEWPENVTLQPASTGDSYPK